MKPPGDRRGQHRHTFRDSAAARIEFGYPEPDGHFCTMRLRDLSASGLSVVLACELPGLEPGRCIDGVTVRVGERAFQGDLLVMHVTPGGLAGSVFGALFYPATDADLLVLRETISSLERRA